MTAADISDMKDDRRRARCGGVSGDVAKKAAELLNIHFGYMAAPVVEETDDSQALRRANQYLGEAEGFGGPVKVKVTMDGAYKIAKIDVLSHGETARHLRMLHSAPFRKPSSQLSPPRLTLLPAQLFPARLSWLL